MLKTSSFGDILWSVSVGGSGFDLGFDIETDAMGSVFVTGLFSEEMAIGEKLLVSAGSGDGFVVKLSPEGQAQWGARFGGESGESVEMLTVTPNGKVAILGEFYVKNTNNELTRSRVVQTYDSSGAVDTDWGFLGENKGHIAWANDGRDLYLHGSVDTPQTLGSGTTELSDTFLARIAPGGDVLWSVPAESREWRGMVVDGEDRVHLISDSRTGSGHGRYVWVTSYSKDGDKLGRSEVITEIGGAQVTAIATGPGGRIVVTGCVREDGFFGGDELLFITEMRTP